MLERQFHKRDTVIWSTWGVFPKGAFMHGMSMLLPSGRTVLFVPCERTSRPALKPIKSPGYKEWINTPLQTELVVQVEEYHRPNILEDMIKASE